MAKTEKMKKFRWQAHKPLLAAALAVAGVFNMVSVVIAEGVAAGTDISNTATATYNDGEVDPVTGNPVNEFDATSNTVVIKVAEIAGLTAVARPIVDADGGAIEDGDDLTFIFDVTNVGNAPTNVFIPVPTTENVDLDLATNPVEVFASDGTPLGTLTSEGLVVDPGTGNPVPLSPDDFFVVQVQGTPSAGTVAGDTVGVTLGNTADNPDEGPDPTQNQPDDSEGAPGNLLTDLRTVDPTDADATDDPENGEREAEATADATFASSVRPLALATVLKTAATVNVGNPSVATDDLITYDLGLRVEDSEPTNLFQPSALEGTDITLGATAATAVTEKRILVSDSIPVGTVLESVSTSLPAGWIAVYTVDASDDALSLTWVTTPPTDLSTVERIGFVFDGTIPNNGIATTGLIFTVETSGTTPPVDGTVENIAQVFGQTVGDPNSQVIYDESGDQNPNNYDPVLAEYPDPDGSDYDPTVDTGIVPESDGNGDGQPDTPGDVDNGNDNSGSGPDGEPNVVLLNPTTDDILNGTQDTPNAVGPVGDNDDFTNQSTPTPAAGTDPTAPFDPAPVVFNNSLLNPATTGNIANVTIEPLSPSQSEAASEDPNNPGDTDGFFGSDSDIPNGTLITITAPGVAPAVYEYVEDGNPLTDDGEFVIQPGSIPVNVGAVVAGEEVDYTVTVDLPAGTAQLDEVPIPIIAFADDEDDVLDTDIGYSGEVTNNITIDRVYTGFMELVKEAQILAADGTTILEPFAQVLTENAAPGEFIEYRITYRNISQAATGFGSVTLTANDFVLLEDGNDAAVGNDWATTTTHQQNTAASAGDVNYFTNSTDVAPIAPPGDPSDGTTVEKYTNVVPTVAPEVDGTFEFRRVVD